MKCLITPALANQARRFHHRVVNGKIRYYYTLPDFPLLSLVVREKELAELSGRVHWVLFGQANGDLAREALPGAPGQWAGGPIMQATITEESFGHWSRRLRAADLETELRRRYDKNIGLPPR